MAASFEETTHTGKCEGRSRQACWSAAARADPGKTASPCRPRRTPTGPRRPPSPARPRTAAAAPGCEISHPICETIPPGGRERSRDGENFVFLFRCLTNTLGVGEKMMKGKKKPKSFPTWSRQCVLRWLKACCKHRGSGKPQR